MLHRTIRGSAMQPPLPAPISGLTVFSMAESVESVRILEGGRIVIPARFRRALGLKTGDTLSLVMDGDALRLESRLAGIRRARELVKPYLGTGSLADELIAERHAEAEAEDA